MPKIEPKLTNRKDGRAVVHYKGKMYVMGKSGTPEAKTAFYRFCVELQNNPSGYVLPNGADSVTMQELCAGYIAAIEGRVHPAHFSHHKTIIADFLLPIYGDCLADAFTTKCLKHVRQSMINAKNASGKNRLCIMRVGDVNWSGDIWEYCPKNHKTEEYIGKKVIYLGKPEQKLLLPYLEGKAAGRAVFSPAQAMAKRFAGRRAKRKTKITPSQAERNRQRAVKPVQYAEFYDANSYRKAVGFAITAANKVGENVPRWTPYGLECSAKIL